MKNRFTYFPIIFLAATFLFAFTDYSSTSSEDPLKESMKRGKVVYEANCLSCHMAAGEGIAGVFPPLAKADYLMADTKRSIRQIIFGAKGPMKVNGVTYNGEMTALGLNDQQVMDVLNYIRNSWGNKGKIVTLDEVKAARKK